MRNAANSRGISFAAKACLAAIFCGSIVAAASPLPLRTLGIGQHTLKVEVADTLPALGAGLSNRDALAPDHGLLLVFPSDRGNCLWMKDTRIPLSAAFLDRAGRIISMVAAMAPNSTNLHCTGAGAAFAIEAEAGWFERHGVQVGTVVDNLPPSSAAAAAAEARATQ